MMEQLLLLILFILETSKINTAMKICEIFGIGTVLPSSGQYQTPSHGLEFQKKKPKKKNNKEKKKIKSPLEKGQGKTLDIEV